MDGAQPDLESIHDELEGHFRRAIKLRKNVNYLPLAAESLNGLSTAYHQRANAEAPTNFIPSRPTRRSSLDMILQSESLLDEPTTAPPGGEQQQGGGGGGGDGGAADDHDPAALFLDAKNSIDYKLESLASIRSLESFLGGSCRPKEDSLRTTV